MHATGPKPWPEGRERLWIAGLLLLFALLAAYFSVVVPAFETPDEFQHLAFVQHIVTWYDLPRSEPNTPGLWQQQGTQAPLYYIAGAILTGWIDMSDFPVLADRINPYARLGQETATENRNYFLAHDDDGWPWSGTFLALHILRLWSILLCCIALWATYRFVRLFLAPSLALPATAVLAFVPQFVFIGASANNDNLIVAAAAVLIWRLAEWMRFGDAPHYPQDRRVAVHQGWSLGAWLGIALGAKLSGLGLTAVVLLALTWIAWRRGDGRFVFDTGWRMAVPATMVSGWWYIRNLLMYRDPLAWNIWEANIDLRRETLTISGFVRELPFMFRSFWGVFGGLTLPYPKVVYTVLGILTLVAVAGFLLWFLRWARRLDPEQYLFHDAQFMQGMLAFSWLGILLVAWLRFMLVAPAAQGRYLFPAIPVLALVVGLGAGLWPAGVRKILVIVPAGLFLLSTATPSWIIDPAFVPPESLRYADAGWEVHRDWTGPVDDHPSMQLSAVDLPSTVTPGKSVRIHLQLVAIDQPQFDWALFLHLRDRDGNIVAQFDSFPGGGLWPTTQWPIGEERQERITVSVPAHVEPDAELTWVFGLYHPVHWTRTHWVDADHIGPINRDATSNELFLGTSRVVQPAAAEG
ncbi:MAG: hypothetical protein OXH72_05485 [Caldilineaceae bacterium]|nr:hypothetical protein [Caldilineaceae bacterium]